MRDCGSSSNNPIIQSSSGWFGPQVGIAPNVSPLQEALICLSYSGNQAMD